MKDIKHMFKRGSEARLKTTYNNDKKALAKDNEIVLF